MEFNNLELYEVVEAKDCLVIFNRGTRLGGMLSTPLMAGPPATVPEYLARYFDARLAGKSLDDAHNIAIKGAHIITAGALGRPKIL